MGNWTNNMKHFLIITNEFKDKNLKQTNEIKGYIEKKGGSCQCFTSTGDDAKTQHLRLMRLHRRQSVCLC